MANQKKPRNPDHVRRVNVPGLQDETLEAEFEELLSPAIYAQSAYYRSLGLRDRILNLPLMVAAILALLWRQIPSVCELTKTLNREGVLWMHPVAENAVIELVVRFNEALNRQDVDTMMGLMTEDCVFENTDPPPEGTRYEGQKAVRAFWEEFFRDSQERGIEIEEIFAAGERCVMRWVYHWVDAQGEPGHIRGVDIYKIRGDKIAEKLSYVKG